MDNKELYKQKIGVDMKCVMIKNGYEVYEYNEAEIAQYGEYYIVVKAGNLNALDMQETRIEIKPATLQEADEFISQNSVGRMSKF